ncbi:CPBP family intramembrane glutamic endopeptidase [Floridanema evergladense]|uniref:Lysostaphin resistance A-like protein n=1 Tax=Floridaenema evergladense BLCC-F167 TaxID=3153639 RepID=A0ABV4WM05_9CYAN
MDTQTDSKIRLLLRILRFPLTRLLLLSYILFYVTFSGKVFIQTFTPSPVPSLIVGLLTVANLLLVYVSFAHFVERRSVSELTLPGMGRELGIGLLLGFGLFTTCVLIAMVLGLYRIEGIDSWQQVLPTGGALVTPVGEEMLFRGVVFRIFEEVFGGWVALIVSSVAFGLTHSGNEGETLAGIASIAIVFGPMLAAPYMVTRRLWMGIGLHGAWNYTMGKIFSGSVSGGQTGQGLFKTTFVGPELLTGGSAGMEGSLIAILVSATASVILLILAVQRGKIVPPSWKRRA